MENRISIREAEQMTARINEEYFTNRQAILAEMQEAKERIGELSGAAHRAAQLDRQERLRSLRQETAERIQAERARARQAVADIRQRTVWEPADEANLENRARHEVYMLQRRLAGLVLDERALALRTEEAPVTFERTEGEVVFTITVPLMRMEDFGTDAKGEERP